MGRGMYISGTLIFLMTKKNEQARWKIHSRAPLYPPQDHMGYYKVYLTLHLVRDKMDMGWMNWSNKAKEEETLNRSTNTLDSSNIHHIVGMNLHMHSSGGTQRRMNESRMVYYHQGKMYHQRDTTRFASWYDPKLHWNTFEYLKSYNAIICQLTILWIFPNHGEKRLWEKLQKLSCDNLQDEKVITLIEMDYPFIKELLNFKKNILELNHILQNQLKLWRHEQFFSVYGPQYDE